MTCKKKTEEIIRFLTENHLWFYGGHPFDYAIIDNLLVVAGLIDGATCLRAWRMDDLPKWFDAAQKMKQESTDCDWQSCLWETVPDEVKLTADLTAAKATS